MKNFPYLLFYYYSISLHTYVYNILHLEGFSLGFGTKSYFIQAALMDATVLTSHNYITHKDAG